MEKNTTASEAAMRDLLRRWADEVWHQGRLEVVKEIVGSEYVRHEPDGTKTVSPEQYAAEIAALRRRIPDIRFREHAHAVNENLYWMRWSYEGTDSESGKKISRAGLQVYRVENGKLVETWLAMHAPGSCWLV